MRLLVVGGAGLVGSHLVAQARAGGRSVVGTHRRAPLGDTAPLDLADTVATTALLDAARPDAVVHCAGWTWVDGCEDDPDRALRENATQPGWLAARCRERGLRFAYFSSSYVFDGRGGPYAEDDAPAPVGVYASSKLAGERAVLDATDGEALVARLICVYGREAQRKNFAYQVLRAMREGAALTVPSDQRGNPTPAADVARWSLALLDRGASGVWHLPGPDPDCARPEWGARLAAAYAAQGVTAAPGFALRAVATVDLGQRAPRPLRAGMVTRRGEPAGADPTPLGEVVREILAE